MIAHRPNQGGSGVSGLSALQALFMQSLAEARDEIARAEAKAALAARNLADLAIVRAGRGVLVWDKENRGYRVRYTAPEPEGGGDDA